MAQAQAAMMEDFASLLDESFKKSASIEGSVLKGHVVRIDDDFVLVDVGLKSEGRIPLKEFARGGRDIELSPGDRIDVFVERYEDRDGLIMLSRDKARREEAWNVLEEQHTKTPASKASSSAASKAASRSTSTAPWPSFPARRSISAPCATSPR